MGRANPVSNFTCNKSEMRELVDALRSGDYAQGRGVLRKADDRFCCLGVYCDLRVKRNLGKWSFDDAADNYRYVDEGGFTSGSGLTPMASNHLGAEGAFPAGTIAKEDDPLFEDIYLGSTTAIKMNDSGYHFGQIAHALEELYLTD
jgi:hypothetical protein